MSDRRDAPSNADVEQLLKQSVVEEAVTSAMDHFEKALKGLDAESFQLLNEFLNGDSANLLAERRGITTPEAEKWLARAKHQLVQNLRTKCKVRQ